jgi:hypothetical protein
MPKKNSVVPVIPEVVVPEQTIASLPVTTDPSKKTRESASAWLKSNMNSKQGE